MQMFAVQKKILLMKKYTLLLQIKAVATNNISLQAADQ